MNENVVTALNDIAKAIRESSNEDNYELYYENKILKRDNKNLQKKVDRLETAKKSLLTRLEFVEMKNKELEYMVRENNNDEFVKYGIN